MHVYNQAPRQKYLHLTHISILDKHYRSESNESDTDTLYAFQVDLLTLYVEWEISGKNLLVEWVGISVFFPLLDCARLTGERVSALRLLRKYRRHSVMFMQDRSIFIVCCEKKMFLCFNNSIKQSF